MFCGGGALSPFVCINLLYMHSLYLLCICQGCINSLFPQLGSNLDYYYFFLLFSFGLMYDLLKIGNKKATNSINPSF